MSQNPKGRTFTLHGSLNWKRKRELSLPYNDQLRRRGPGAKGRIISEVESSVRGQRQRKWAWFPVSGLPRLGTSPFPSSVLALPPPRVPAGAPRHPASRLCCPASHSPLPLLHREKPQKKLPGRLGLDQLCPGRCLPGSSQHSRPQPWLRAVEATGNWMLFLSVGLPVHFPTHATPIETAPRFAFKSS